MSATATTTAQSLTVGTAMTSFSPLAPSGGPPDFDGTTHYLYSYSGTLPAGISLDTGTGAVTGTPTATYATMNIVFSVQDASGVVANTTSTVSFTVGAAGAITATANTAAQSLKVGTAMTSFSPLAASGGAAPYTYSITTGTLPAGLSLDARTGAVTGTPTAAAAAAHLVFSVKGANNVVASTTSTVSFTVGAAGAITATANTAAPNLTVGIAMARFTPLAASGGTAPYTYSVTTGTLPDGLFFNASTGAVTGSPVFVTYATTNIVFSVHDANNIAASTTSTVSFTVVAASVDFTATPNAWGQNLTADRAVLNLTVGFAMTSFTPLSASGGAVPYTYSITLGTLPAGLSLDAATGALTGTPTTVSYSAANVVFAVKDANNVTASATSTVSFTARPGPV